VKSAGGAERIFFLSGDMMLGAEAPGASAAVAPAAPVSPTQKRSLNCTFLEFVDRADVRPDRNCHRLSQDAGECHRTGVRVRQSPELAAGGAKLRAASSIASGCAWGLGPKSERNVGMAEPRRDERDRHALQMHQGGASVSSIVQSYLRHVETADR
jgi:hypothetical protein